MSAALPRWRTALLPALRLGWEPWLAAVGADYSNADQFRNADPLIEGAFPQPFVYLCPEPDSPQPFCPTRGRSPHVLLLAGEYIRYPVAPALCHRVILLLCNVSATVRLRASRPILAGT